MAEKEASDIEYSIVAYFHPKLEKSEESELVETMNDMDAAFKKAQSILNGGQYYKAEVKQKYFEPKTERQLEMVLKTFEQRAKKPVSMVMIILVTLVVTGLAFGGAFFLGQSMNGKSGKSAVVKEVSR